MSLVLPMRRVELAKKLVMEGGEVIRKNIGKSIKSREKTKNDFVTEIDTQIETSFIKKISRLFPEDSIWGEEGGERKGVSPYKWLIDPLDGTNNFVRGIPHCGIQIAICYKDEVVDGFIFNPFMEELYFASKSKGAFCKNMKTRVTKRAKVSEFSLKESSLIFTSGIAKNRERSAHLFDFIGNVARIRIYGVAVLDLPFVAFGNADLLVSDDPKPYDIAAGCLLVEEAGGRVTDFQGNPWTPNIKTLLATNGKNFQEALAITRNYFLSGKKTS
jgi:myo-inositol-1(or 4)-monophosphatase